MAGFSLGELFVSLGFDVDDEKLKSFNDQIKDTQRTLLHIGEAATGAIVGLYALLDGPLSKASQLKQFGDVYGYNSQKAQEWATSVSLLNRNVSYDQAFGQMNAFAQYIQNMNRGGGGNLLGSLLPPGEDFKLDRDPTEYLQKLVEQFRSGGWQARWGDAWRSVVNPNLQGIGIDPGSFYAYASKTNAERQKLTQGLLQTPEQQAELDKTNQAFGVLVSKWEMLATKFAVENGDKITEFLEKLTVEIPKVITQVDHIAEAMGGWKDVALELAAAFGIIKAMQLTVLLAGIGDALLGIASGAGGGVLGGLLKVGLGFGAGIAGITAGGGALALGTAIPIMADKQWHWGNKFANFLDSSLGDNNIIDRSIARIGDTFTGGNAYRAPKEAPEPRVEHLLGDTTINIHSNQDPKEIAAETKRVLERHQQESLTRAYDQTNLGAQY